MSKKGGYKQGERRKNGGGVVVPHSARNIKSKKFFQGQGIKEVRE